MTITLPLRRMTLHFSQIGFTDGLTFIVFILLRGILPKVRLAIRPWTLPLLFAEGDAHRTYPIPCYLR